VTAASRQIVGKPTPPPSGQKQIKLAVSFLILPEGRGSRLVGDRLRSSRKIR
jgi:hypothetical protein